MTDVKLDERLTQMTDTLTTYFQALERKASSLPDGLLRGRLFDAGQACRRAAHEINSARRELAGSDGKAL